MKGFSLELWVYSETGQYSEVRYMAKDPLKYLHLNVSGRIPRHRNYISIKLAKNKHQDHKWQSETLYVSNFSSIIAQIKLSMNFGVATNLLK